MTASLETLSYFQQVLAAAAKQTWAVVTQNPDGTVNIAVDVGPGPASDTVTPLEGGTGAAGTAQFPLQPMPDIYDSPEDLPAIGVLSNTAADIGKFWIIFTTNEQGFCTSVGAYIWFGTEYRFLPLGNEGSPGPYGVMKPYVNLVGPDQISEIEVSDTAGTAKDPYLVTMDLSIPEGPPGRSCPLGQFTDVDESTPPIVGQFLAVSERTVTVDGDPLPIWTPQDVGSIFPQPYIVPASAFTAQFGVTFGDAEATIATFSVPAQPFPWKPLIWGQVQMWEFGLSFTDMFSIGIEVLLGSPNPAVGTLVARGFGNDVGGTVTIMPHTSKPTNGTTKAVAMNPWNNVGLVPANHGGTQSTLYVNIVNDGNIFTIYDYQPSTAQLFVLACPSTAQAELRPMVYGALHTKITLQAQMAVDIDMQLSGNGAFTSRQTKNWPITQQFQTSGVYTPPSWWTSGTDYLDLIVVTDGGGGATASNNSAGAPGVAGTWITQTLHTLASGHLMLTLGTGGKGSQSLQSGAAGTGVTIKDGATTVLSGSGGTGGVTGGGGPLTGTGWYGPAPAQTQTYQGVTYYAGATTTTAGASGSYPGGGGAGANQIFENGGNGAAATAWIVARKGP